MTSKFGVLKGLFVRVVLVGCALEIKRDSKEHSGTALTAATLALTPVSVSASFASSFSLSCRVLSGTEEHGHSIILGRQIRLFDIGLGIVGRCGEPIVVLDGIQPSRERVSCSEPFRRSIMLRKCDLAGAT